MKTKIPPKILLPIASEKMCLLPGSGIRISKKFQDPDSVKNESGSATLVVDTYRGVIADVDFSERLVSPLLAVGDAHHALPSVNRVLLLEILNKI